MEKGEIRQLTVTPETEYRAVISPDGSKAAFGRRRSGGGPDLYVIQTSGGVEEKLGTVGGLMSWSPDSQRVLYWEGEPIRYMAIDVKSQKVVQVISDPEHSIHTAKYSPDGNWLSFRLAMPSGGDPTYIAPLRDGVAASREEWIQVLDASERPGRTWWSPDGKLLYFLSSRDGYECIWAQPLELETKKPQGKPLEISHFHQPQRLLSSSTIGYGLAPDKLYLSVHSTTSNIWLAEPQNAGQE